jgi:hypothetical protein
MRYGLRDGRGGQPYDRDHGEMKSRQNLHIVSTPHPNDSPIPASASASVNRRA